MRDSRFAAFVLIFGVAPALIKKSKPLARYMGDQFIRVGEFLKHGTEEPPVVAKEPVAKQESVHTNATVESAGPAGKDEIATHLTAEAMGDGAASEPVKAKPRAAKKPATSAQPQNPKKTKISKP